MLAEKENLQGWMKVAVGEHGEHRTCEMLRTTFRNEPGLLLSGFTEDSLLKIARKGGETKSKTLPFSKEVFR